MPLTESSFKQRFGSFYELSVREFRELSRITTEVMRDA
jgi:hypothetical protein